MTVQIHRYLNLKVTTKLSTPEGNYAASDKFIIDYLVSYKDNSGANSSR
ncbi:hypothetical protein O9993_16255 [Vibrio lentus]|nr:hypothetical protein [Vibrio lentus]